MQLHPQILGSIDFPLTDFEEFLFQILIFIQSLFGLSFLEHAPKSAPTILDSYLGPFFHSVKCYSSFMAGGTNRECRAAAPSVFVKLEICDTLRKIYPTSFLELLPALKSFNEGVFCKLLWKLIILSSNKFRRLRISTDALFIAKHCLIFCPSTGWVT